MGPSSDDPLTGPRLINLIPCRPRKLFLTEANLFGCLPYLLSLCPRVWQKTLCISASPFELSILAIMATIPSGNCVLIFPRPPLCVFPTLTQPPYGWWRLGRGTALLFSRQCMAQSLSLPRRLPTLFRQMIPFFRWFVWGLTLTTQLVVWTTLLLRLIIIIAPFNRRSRWSMRTSPLALWSRRLTSGLLRTHRSFIRSSFSEAVRPTCRSLLLESEPSRWPSARHFRLILNRNRTWSPTLARTWWVTLVLRGLTRRPLKKSPNLATGKLISLETPCFFMCMQPVLGPRWALRYPG